MTDKTDKIRAAVEQFAQKAGVTQDEYNEMLEKADAEMTKRGIADDKKEYYTLKRVQLALKMKFSSSSQEAEGFFIGKQSVFDYAKKPRKAVDDFIQEQGKDAAIRDKYCDATLNPINYHTKEELESYILNAGRAAAKNAKMIDDEGNYLYTNDQFRNGKQIPKTDFGTVAYGVFTMPGDDEPKLSQVNLRGEDANKNLPLFKMVKFGAKLNKDKSTSQFHQLAMTRSISEVGDKVSFDEYEELIKQAVPGRVLDSLDEMPTFIENHNEFRTWCVVRAEVTELGISGATGNVPVRISDFSLDSMNADEANMTFWMDENMDVKLTEGAVDVVFVLNPYVNQKNEISGNVIGAWVDPIWQNDIEDISEDDILSPW